MQATRRQRFAASCAGSQTTLSRSFFLRAPGTPRTSGAVITAEAAPARFDRLRRETVSGITAPSGRMPVGSSAS